ncbi:MAG: flagellar export chaperone FlgN [Thermoguttaceae bacterium]
MKSDTTTPNFETEIAAFLQRLAVVQDDALSVLQRKQKMLVAADAEALQQILIEEERLMARLESVLAERQTILEKARDFGIACESLETLSETFPKRSDVRREIHNSVYRTRLIQYQSLTNWVLTQRSLLCVNQMLDIIAGGGKASPVYSHDKKRDHPGGNIAINRVA